MLSPKLLLDTPTEAFQHCLQSYPTIKSSGTLLDYWFQLSFLHLNIDQELTFPRRHLHWILHWKHHLLNLRLYWLQNQSFLPCHRLPQSTHPPGTSSYSNLACISKMLNNWPPTAVTSTNGKKYSPASCLHLATHNFLTTKKITRNYWHKRTTAYFISSKSQFTMNYCRFTGTEAYEPV